MNESATIRRLSAQEVQVSRKINVAAIQMDANPAPTADRLARAERLVVKAAKAGAQLVVLPELFNIGYAYADVNYRLAEPLDGPTVAWMQQTSARLNVHLAGSLLVLDQDDVYNTLLLLAPDGQMWRYDKHYPWGWERAYFRPGDRITVAKTELGDLGMMICWDIAHRELWKRYAGRVDMLIIASCPPDIPNATYHLPNGDQLTADDMGPLIALLKENGRLTFGDMLNQQTAWLGTPVVHTVGSGHIQTALPNARTSLLSFLLGAPWLVKHLPRADRIQVSCDMLPGCRVLDANGQALAELTQDQGETFIITEVVLAAEKPSPQKPPPASPLPWFAYFISDMLLPLLTLSVYRKGLRRAWGEGMAPVQASTRRWVQLLGLSVIAGFVAGLLAGRKKL